MHGYINDSHHPNHLWQLSALSNFVRELMNVVVNLCISDQGESSIYIGECHPTYKGPLPSTEQSIFA